MIRPHLVRMTTLGLALLPSILSAPASGELVAEQITAQNRATHYVGGPDADAGIGDWFLSNGTICAAITDPTHESAMTPRGGVLTDLGHCGANDDQWVVLQPMLNLSQSHVVPVTEIEAGHEAARAWIRTRAVFAGIELITTYAVEEDQPNTLDISTRAKRLEDGDSLFSIGHILLHTSGQTPAFSLLQSDLDRSIGFVYPATDRHSLSSLLDGLIASDLTILVGGDAMPPISYGLERLTSQVRTGGKLEALASFSVSGKHFTFINSMTSPLWFGEEDEAPGLLQFAQIPFMDITDKTVLESDYRIHVGGRADVASVTDLIWHEAPLVMGSVDDPDARIHIDRDSGAPMTEIRPDADGAFQLRLPPGRYRARTLAPGNRESSLDFEIRESAASQRLPPIVLGQPAWVRLPTGFIGRLTFLNEKGSGPAVFGANLLGHKIGEKAIPSGLEAPYLNFASSLVDPERVALAPGRYRVVAVRGPEYEARVIGIEARRGEEIPLELEPLARILPTPGWLSVDFHVHSGESFDSNLPQPQQVVAFAASGAEVLVATEHDRIFDPRPAIAASGLEKQLVSITGVEITSSYKGGDSPHATGHLNAFPVEPVPGSYRQGAPTLEGRRLRDALADIAKLSPAPFVQMNHPRPAQELAVDDLYFMHLGVVGEPFNPTRPLTQYPNAALVERSPTHGGRDLDFDGIELMNAESLLRYRRVRADWFSMMLQGERIIGTANSDSHRLGVIVGLPRTYIAVENDTLENFQQAALMRSLRGGGAWGTTGPLLHVDLGGTPLGALHDGSKAILHLKVTAAPWVPVDEWRAYVNGELVHRAPIAAGESAELPLAFARDAFVTVEVEGPAEGLYAEAFPQFTPFAFTNPIFVDTDGNGRFDPPGLPDDLPATLTDPDRPD
ncbi:MAG: CehA/McbA family metallohydrolase [bacterium]|nr:CehA/McbA family metallohydrolase [bacterium]